MTSNGLVPLIRYRDVAAAVEWLSNTFHFEKRSVVTDPDGTVAYAELSYGRGIVMLGPVGQSILDSLMKQPDEVGGVGTQSVYVAVDDVEAHFKNARDAGADIVLEFGSEEAGDRAYAARDLEGHIWNFGAYSPWPAAIVPPLEAAAEPAFAVRPSLGQAVLGGAVAMLAIASVAGLATLEARKPEPRFMAAPAAPPATVDSAETAALRETLAREAHARQEAARSAAAIREELAREKAQRLAAEAARQALQTQLAQRPATSPAQATVAATPPPVAQPPSETAAAPAAPAAEPVTTGSLGDEPSEAELSPPSDAPAPPVTVGPPTPQLPAAQTATPQPTTPSPTTSTTVPLQKPKAAKPRSQAQKKTRPAPRKSTGNDPLFMYD